MSESDELKEVLGDEQPPGIGHNSDGADDEHEVEAGGVAGERLRSFIERVERLEEERAALTADVREVYAEAKAVGFSTKIMRQVVKLRKMDRSDRQEEEHLLDLYKRAVGLD